LKIIIDFSRRICFFKNGKLNLKIEAGGEVICSYLEFAIEFASFFHFKLLQKGVIGGHILVENLLNGGEDEIYRNAKYSFVGIWKLPQNHYWSR